MYKYCIFLRGINVNGVKFKMKDLVTGMHRLGYSNVETVLATGNIILGVDSPINHLDEFKLILQQQLSDLFKYEAFLFVRDFAWIETQLNKYNNLNIPDNHQTYCLILDHKTTSVELFDIYNQVNLGKYEKLLNSDEDLLWIVEKGFTLLSEFGKKALGKKYFKDKLTSRNMNTITKMYNKMK